MKARLAIAAALGVLALAVWVMGSSPAAADPAPVKLQPVAQPEPTAALEPTLIALPPPQPVAPVLAARALASAQTTVQSQLSLLGDNQYDLFVQTFAEQVRPSITREAFDACRVRINQVPVLPDWEVAEPSTHEGRRVLAVSMFGKSLTEFEEVDGRWLAGSPWCVPVGLP